MKSILTERTLKIFLPAAGYILALGALAALVAPVLSKAYHSWTAQTVVAVEESQEHQERRPATLVARSAGSRDYLVESVVSDSSHGIALPKAKRDEEQAQEEMEEATETSLQGYMPILGGKQQQKQRRLTKAERKRIQEKRDRQENWAYADPDEVVEDAEKDVWEKDSAAKDKQEEFEEDETVESIVLGDKKNLLIYKFISGDSGKTDKDKGDSAQASAAEAKAAASSREAASAQADYAQGMKSDSSLKLFDSKSSSLSFSDSSLYQGHDLMSQDNPLFSSSGSGALSLFNTADSSPARVRGDNLSSLDAIKTREQSINNFRAMIAPKAETPLSNPNKAIITSSSGNLLSGNEGLGLSSTKGLSLPTTPLPGTEGSLSGSSSTPASREIMPRTPERSLMQEGNSTRAIPRLIIRR